MKNLFLKTLLKITLFYLLINNYAFSQGAGNSLIFDGNDDYISVSQLNGKFHTIEFWIYNNNTWNSSGSGNAKPIISFGGSNGSGYFLWSNSSVDNNYITNELITIGKVSGSKATAYSGTNLTPGWHHIAIVSDWNGNGNGNNRKYSKIYVDGILGSDLQTRNNGCPVIENETIYIGARPSSSSFLNGQIDELRIWSVPRTRAQIRAKMCERLSPNESNLLLHYTFDDINNISGTLSGNPQQVPSTAPIGDVSINDYNSNMNGRTLSIESKTLNGVDYRGVTVENLKGNLNGAFLYRVDNEPLDKNGIETELKIADQYYGIFLVNSTTSNYNIKCNYSSYSFATNFEPFITLKAKGYSSPWINATQIIDVDNDEITSTTQQNSSQFIITEKELSTTEGSGSSLVLDGTDDSIETDTLHGAYHTIEFWAKSDVPWGSNSEGSALFSFSRTANVHYIWANAGIGGIDDEIIHIRNTSLGSRRSVYHSTLPISQGWHHFAIVSDGNFYTKCYVDGVELTFSEGNFGQAAIFQDCIIDIGKRGSGAFFNGELDELRIWNYSRTETQIKEYMCRTLSGAEKGLLLYYDFDDNSNSTIQNSATQNINAQLQGAPSFAASTAPIGDFSVYAYQDSWNTVAVSMSSNDNRDSFSMFNINGAPKGVHIYRVDKKLNNQGHIVGSLPISPSYFGTFIAYGSSPQYNVMYDFTQNDFLTRYKPNISLYTREDKLSENWTTSQSNINSNSDIITENGFTTAKEFILGGKSVGSGKVIDFQSANSNYVRLDTIRGDYHTIEFWINNESGWGNFNGTCILGMHRSNSYRWIWANGCASGFHHELISINNLYENSSCAYYATTNYFTNGWHHVAIVSNGNANYDKVYIDGVMKSLTIKGNGAPIFSDSQIDIGARQGSSNFEGQIDELRIWNYPRTETQIKEYMCQTISGNEDGLLAYFKFDEGSGNSTTDIAKGYIGSLENNPSWIESTAPIGDSSVYFYPTNKVWSNETLAFDIPSIGEIDIENLNVTDNSLAPEGVHLYQFYHDPNNYQGVDNVIPENHNYFGVFIAGENEKPTYDINYNFNQYSLSPVLIEHFDLYTRPDLNTTDWFLSENITEIDNSNVQLTGVNGNIEFLLSEADIEELPVTLVSFNCEITVDNIVEISWETATEINNDYFIIEKSHDRRKWDILEEIDGNGNSNTSIFYETTDENPFNSVTYYRLKQVDFDGKYEYFEIKEVRGNVNFSKNELKIYPIPAENEMNVVFKNFNPEKAMLFNLNGMNVTSNIIAKKINDDYTVYDLSKLDDGMYIFKYKKYTTKIIKNKLKGRGDKEDKKKD